MVVAASVIDMEARFGSNEERDLVAGQTSSRFAACSTVVVGSGCLLIAFWWANHVLSGPIFGIGLACFCRLHQPTPRRCAAAFVCTAFFMSSFMALDVRVVRTLWPLDRGITATNVLVVRLPFRNVRRGDLVAWRLDSTSHGKVAIDRVLAMPGEVLHVGGGAATASSGNRTNVVWPVLGVRSSWAFTLDVDQREFGIIPSTVAWRPSGPEPQPAESQTIAQNSRVRSEQIVGHVLLVQNSWGMWWRP
jgi:hypothetical protein